MFCAGIALPVLIATTVVAQSPREEISLNGRWEFRLVDDLDKPAPEDGWKPCDVPGYLEGIDYQRAWFRRPFVVPDTMRGNRITIRFGGVKYNSRVFVNGKNLGGCLGGYEPFVVDVTAVVRFGGVNHLQVGCHDWTGVFTGERVDFRQTQEWHRVRNAPRDRILSPIGGLYGLYGLWDDVTLQSHPAVCVQDVFIKPSVRRKELVAEYVLANESGSDAHVELTAAVEEDGKDVLSLKPVRVSIPAGGTATATVRQSWANPHLWSHIDPHLYHLRTELSSGDRMRTRFGFREFWVDGHQFYLNGTKINLLATSWWPPHSPMTRQEIRERWEAVKQCGCIAFRTHTQPWRNIHYDVADEIGLLMIIEGAVWNDESTYRINDPTFWKNYAGHLKAMVERDKNHPSVIMWSLENEFYGGRFNDEAPAKQDLIRMGRLVKQWDPTRPIYYESDGDPGGVADCIGIHYPHEYPRFTCWPNEADWLAKPSHIPQMFHDDGTREDNEAKETEPSKKATDNERRSQSRLPQFFWTKNKPLYIGEFLWLPSRDPSWHTVFFGDDAYRDYRRYRDLGKAESWKMQILGYRHHEVAGISPWTVIEGGPLDETNPLYRAHQYAYQHIAAYCHNYDCRFFSGETVERRVEVFNDVMEPSKLRLDWTLQVDGNVSDRGSESMELGPAEHAMLHVPVRMPAVDRRTKVQWKLTLQRDRGTVFEDSHTYNVFPRIQSPKLTARVGLFDPAGKAERVFAAQGLPAVPVAKLDALDQQIDVLVIGADTLEAHSTEGPVIGRVLPERASLSRFVERGGRVLVLEQQTYPDGLFNVSCSDHGSTMTFPLRTRHPALKGIEPDDLKFWRGDHMVAANEPARPTVGGITAIVVSGAADGLAHAPLLEQPVGRGCIVYSQLKLTEKCTTEPAAAQILSNLLDYLASYRSRPRRTAVVSGDDAYRGYLRSTGLQFDDLTGKSESADLSQYSLLICRGDADASQVRTVLERGGNVLVHRADEALLNRLNETLHQDLISQPYSGPVTRAEGDHPLLEAVTREDLYWLGKHVGIGWATTQRATDMVDSVFSKTIDGKKVTTYEVENWTLKGGIVERRKPGVAFATNGSASADIEFPSTGEYVIGVRARGSVCRGVYPMVRIAVDDVPLGTVSVTGPEWQTVTVFGPIDQGRHRVSVAFINDESDPPREDRNLHVDKVLVAADQSGGDVTFLTTPPGVAAVRHGKGTLVVDQLRWDTEENNARKATRYACSLLTALGGEFTSRLGVSVECERMTPQPGMPHFHVQGTYASVACTGYVATPIQVAGAGRYTVELVASGSSAAGVYPLVAIRIDGKEIGQVQLTSGSWRPYWLEAELSAGNHNLEIAFLNDLNHNGEDRNLMLDKVVFFAEDTH